MVTDPWKKIGGGLGRLLPAVAHVGLLLFYAGVCLVYQLDTLFAGIIWEDAYWIRNPNVDHPLRLTQNWIMHDLGLTYFGTRIILHRAVALGLHALNAWLLAEFFLLFFGSARGALRHNRAAVAGGALLAGLLFCTASHYAVTYLSALSYQLVITFGLGTMIMALLHFTRGSAVYWALTGVCYLLALHSHSFALPIPFFLILLELVTRRRAWPVPRRWGYLARYGLLFVMLGVVLWSYMDNLPDKGSQVHRLGFAPLRYLEFMGDLYARALHGALLKPYLQVEDGYLLRWWVPLLALAVTATLGLRNILSPGRSLGLAGSLLLFFFVWSGFAFPMEMATHDAGRMPWRYYYHAAGGALLMGYLAARLASLVPAWLPGSASKMSAVSALLLLASGAALVLAPVSAGANLGRIFSSETRWELPRAWHPPAGCEAPRRLTRAQVIKALKGGETLRCADMSGLDLKGLDFTGADMRGANLTGAVLLRARMEKARLDGAALLWARGDQGKLSGASLRGADLSGASMGSSDLTGCDLRGANLRWAELDQANLQGANLEGALVEETMFNNADLRGVDLTLMRLVSIYLQGADLRGAKVRRSQQSTVDSNDLKPGAL